MKAAPLHDLPAGYVEARRVVLTERRLFLKLNLLSLIPFVLMFIWLVLWRRVAWSPRMEMVVEIPWLLGIFVVFLVVLPLHELFHGLAIRYFGHRVRFGAKLSKGVLYTTAENAFFRRNEFVVVSLAPLVVITLLAMLLMPLVVWWVAFFVALAAAINAGGAIGDMWATSVVLRYPPSALVRDEADSFRIYAPPDAAGSSTQNTEPPSAG